MILKLKIDLTLTDTSYKLPCEIAHQTDEYDLYSNGDASCIAETFENGLNHRSRAHSFWVAENFGFWLKGCFALTVNSLSNTLRKKSWYTKRLWLVKRSRHW